MRVYQACFPRNNHGGENVQGSGRLRDDVGLNHLGPVKILCCANRPHRLERLRGFSLQGGSCGGDRPMTGKLSRQECKTFFVLQRPVVSADQRVQRA